MGRTREVLAVSLLLVACRHEQVKSSAPTAAPAPPQAPAELSLDITAKQAEKLGAPRELVATIEADLERRLAEQPFAGSTPIADARAGRAYAVEGTLMAYVITPAPGGIKLTCNVAVAVSSLPSRTLLTSARGSADVEAPKTDKLGAGEKCVAAVVEDIVERHVVPLLATKAKALADVSASAATAQGTAFQVPVPSGWTIDPDRKPSGGGVVLVAPKGSGFQGSLVIADAAGYDLDRVETDDACEDVAKSFAPEAQVTVTRTRFIELPIGRSCQIDGVSNTNRRHTGTSTLLFTKQGKYVATCNKDAGDNYVGAVCDEILNLFTLTP